MQYWECFKSVNVNTINLLKEYLDTWHWINEAKNHKILKHYFDEELDEIENN